ncbi:MAG TPA: glycosyltransferase family 39 protein [Nitrososphaeraceae archaeon]
MNLRLQLKDGTRRRSLVFILIPLVLSAYTHLWNPTGFPSIHTDEGHYLRKAISTEIGQGLQPQDRYRAPYFGQIFLAGIFSIIGYPNVETLGEKNPVEQLYLVPRVIMGILAVFDTFLIYRITEYRYGRNVAIIAAILFAVMPFTWMIRRIFLETIQLPFILTSILLILNLTKDRQLQSPLLSHLRPKPQQKDMEQQPGQLQKQEQEQQVQQQTHKQNAFHSEYAKLTLIISGIFLGLAIFTKIPAFTMIPLGIIMVYMVTRKKKYVVVWLIPVLLVPMLWPIHATLSGDMNDWIDGVRYQVSRDRPLINTINTFFQIDPVLFILGMGGLIYAAVKKDYFLLLWAIPIFVFLQAIGYVSSFHLILLLPPFCIAGATMIEKIGNNIANVRMRNMLPYIRIAVIGVFGIASITTLITLNMNSTYYQALAFVLANLPDSNSNATSVNPADKVTLIGNPQYFWIPEFVFNKTFDAKNFYSKTPFKTDKYMMIIDSGFVRILNGDNSSRLNLAYNATHNLARFEQNITGGTDINKYPFTNLRLSPETRFIELRSNY